MSRAVHLVWFLRACFVILGLAVATLVFGPFGGAEQAFGLTDKEAHVIAFYALCAFSLVAFPRLRRGDVALICLAFGGLIELIQPSLGREGSLMDWAADAVGVSLAMLPMMFESLRRKARGDDRERTPKRRRSDRKSDGRVGTSDPLALARSVNERRLKRQTLKTATKGYGASI